MAFHWIELEFSSNWNWIFIELKLNFHWIELEFSLNWTWIFIELNLNFIELNLNFIELNLNFIELKLNFHWIELEFSLNWTWISLNWNWISLNWNWISLNWNWIMVLNIATIGLPYLNKASRIYTAVEWTRSCHGQHFLVNVPVFSFLLRLSKKTQTGWLERKKP